MFKVKEALDNRQRRYTIVLKKRKKVIVILKRHSMLYVFSILELF
jgi:hypothetical protein